MGQAKIVFSKSRLEKALGLALDVNVTGFYTTDDPELLLVKVQSDSRFEDDSMQWLPAEESELPVVHIREALP